MSKLTPAQIEEARKALTTANAAGSRYVITENGRTYTPCCEYSRIRAEEIEASARFARAIREVLDPDKLAQMMVDAATSAHTKRDHKALVNAVIMLLERLPVDADLRRQLIQELR